MPTYPIKPDPEKGFYVLWSTVVDSPVGYGTRREVGEMMFSDWAKTARRQIDAAFDRADAGNMNRGGKDPLIVMEGPGGPGLLPFDRLYEYAHLMMEGKNDRAAELVSPFPDETPSDLS